MKLSLPSKYVRLKKQTWSKISTFKIICIFGALLFFLSNGAGIIDMFIVGYGLASILFIFESRIAIFCALGSLVLCRVFLFVQKDGLAESCAVYAYYFFGILLLTQVRELKMYSEGKLSTDDLIVKKVKK